MYAILPILCYFLSPFLLQPLESMKYLSLWLKLSKVSLKMRSRWELWWLDLTAISTTTKFSKILKLCVFPLHVPSKKVALQDWYTYCSIDELCCYRSLLNFIRVWRTNSFISMEGMELSVSAKTRAVCSLLPTEMLSPTLPMLKNGQVGFLVSLLYCPYYSVV